MKTRVYAAGLVVGLLGGLALMSPRAEAGAQDDVRAAAQAFADAMNAANASQVQAVCTAPLWARYASAFSAAPAPGSFGTFTVGHAGFTINVTEYATALLICRHPDGVEDVVRLTLKNVGGNWKVSGGPTGVTGDAPLG